MHKIILFFLIPICFFYSKEIFAQENVKQDVLVIYSTKDEQKLNELRMLDTILGRFNINYQFINESNIQSDAIQNSSRIIYFGLDKTTFSSETKKALDTFEGKLYVIGHNAEQLAKMNVFQIEGELLVDQIILADFIQRLPEQRIIYHVQASKDEVEQKVLATLEKEQQVPLIVQNDGNYFFAAETMFAPFGPLVADSLYDFLGESQQGVVRYLRLEDVHPKVDAQQLREQAEYLKDKNIPYMVAVIPIYTNKDGETIHFSDSPQLLNTLKYMQENGASIILHGYKHQYRSSETGEGFEFWDVENDRPIYQEDEVPAKKQSDFLTEQEYQEFIKSGEEFERGYIEEAITKGVSELVEQGLYPLGFEAPHYAISQQGYEVVAKHFSSYIGRLQLTDQTYQSEYQPTYVSQPSFLHGMTVYPETLGFIEEGDKQAFSAMEERVRVLFNYRQAYISAFYHPYLGLDGLKKVVSILESVEQATWLDLKEENNQVQIKDYLITSQKGQVRVNHTDVSQLNTHKKQLMYYGIAGIVVFVGILVLFFKKRN
jgi:uncharacterized protein YdaL